MNGMLRDVAQTALRLLPWPTEPGLRVVGHPGPDSPVLITGNYDLTVRRLLRAVAAIDAWVVVATSRGINVWCAAAGGLLSSAQVVTALKTSGIAEAVRHRRAVLPQLAATGVDAKDVARRTGWKLRFGPVYAEDLERYLAAGMHKDDDMRRVRFGAAERVEMAVAWAAPTSLVTALVVLLVSPLWSLPAAVLSWVLALAVFFAYDRLPAGRWPIGAAVSLAVALAGAALLGGGVAVLAGAAALALLVFALLTFDFDGSTPVQGGSFFESRHWHITLDAERCVGIFSCWAVCPEACFEKRDDVRKVELAHDERCVKCGACVVQCPEDALFFTNEDGTRIAPQTIRRYKLNMFGSRTVEVADSAPEHTAGP